MAVQIRSVLERVPQDLVDPAEDVLPPSELDLLLLLRGGDAGLDEVEVGLVLLRVLQDDFDDGAFLPVVEPPLHLDVLALSQRQVLADDLALEDGEGAALSGLGGGGCASVMHDLAE